MKKRIYVEIQMIEKTYLYGDFYDLDDIEESYKITATRHDKPCMKPVVWTCDNESEVLNVIDQLIRKTNSDFFVDINMHQYGKRITPSDVYRYILLNYNPKADFRINMDLVRK